MTILMNFYIIDSVNYDTFVSNLHAYVDEQRMGDLLASLEQVENALQ